MIFFDLEFYVPMEERNAPGTKGTLVFNPARPSNLLLGGHFLAKSFKDDHPRAEAKFWLWRYNQDEPKLLEAIAAFFRQEWESQQADDTKILNKRITDIVTCGFGVGRVDLPALYIRGHLGNVRTPSELFDIFLKTRIIDLSQVACFLFPNEAFFYPKTSNEIISKLLPGKGRKSSGKTVWEQYDRGEYEDIEQRCHKEVIDSIQVYVELQKRLHGLKGFNRQPNEDSTV